MEWKTMQVTWQQERRNWNKGVQCQKTDDEIGLNPKLSMSMLNAAGLNTASEGEKFSERILF